MPAHKARVHVSRCVCTILVPGYSIGMDYMQRADLMQSLSKEIINDKDEKKEKKERNQ